MNAPDADPQQETAYVSTPQGIFTASGIWFQATEDALHTYAGPVLRHVPLRTLLRRAVSWIRSPQVVTLWALPLFLLWIPPLPAALAALTLYVGWKGLSPSFASRYAAALIGWLDHALVQGLFYVFVLSILAAQDKFGALAVGLAGFVLLRWGLMARATGPLVRPLWRSLYTLPVPDQVLRAFIVQAALRHGMDLPQLKRMREQMFERWSRRHKGE